MKSTPPDMQAVAETFESLGVRIDHGFWDAPLENVPVLAQIGVLLEAAAEDPVKLTAKGFLPMKLVERIAKTLPTPSGEHYLTHTKRFLEQEQPAAQRARALCDIGSLLRKSGGKLHLTAKGRGFLEATPNDRYASLLNMHLHFNLGYLDRAQESPLVNSLQAPIAQLLRDIDPLYRGTDVYVALLLERYPQLFDEIEATIVPDSYFAEEPIDEFETLFAIRLLRNFLVPFGLAQERGVAFTEKYEVCKMPLCDALLEPMHAVNALLVLDRKRVGELRKIAREAKLDTPLFEDAVFALAAGMRHPLPPPEAVAEQLVQFRRLIGTAAREHKALYTELAASAAETVRFFTQLDAKGARDDLNERFDGVVEALLSLAPGELPRPLFDTLNTMPEHFLGWLSAYDGITFNDQRSAEQLLERFGREVLEDAGALFVGIGTLRKAAVKGKRVNNKIRALAKECVTAFLLAVMSVYTFKLERE